MLPFTTRMQGFFTSMPRYSRIPSASRVSNWCTDTYPPSPSPSFPAPLCLQGKSCTETKMVCCRTRSKHCLCALVCCLHKQKPEASATVHDWPEPVPVCHVLLHDVGMWWEPSHQNQATAFIRIKCRLCGSTPPLWFN